LLATPGLERGALLAAPRSCKQLYLFTAVAAARTTTESPEGRTENSPGLQAWEGHTQRTRPEGASESGWSQCGGAWLFAFHVRSRFHRLCTRISLVRPSDSAAPSASGRFCVGRLPRPEGLGCSVFALPAIRPSASKSKRGTALNRQKQLPSMQIPCRLVPSQSDPYSMG
jgi:hypothetical protein